MSEAKKSPPKITIETAETPMRVLFNGTEIARSDRVKVLVEGSIKPRFYFPSEDVDQSFLSATAASTHCPWKGDANYWTIRAGGEVSEDAVWSYLNPIPEMQEIAGLLSFYESRVDAIEVVGS